ncbi:MAG: hypothetical protein WCE52_00360 [Candidatus Acidiferrum sp.]
MTSTIHDPKRMELAVRRMIEGRVDGVAILTFGMEDELLNHLPFRNLPLLKRVIGLVAIDLYQVQTISR